MFTVRPCGRYLIIVDNFLLNYLNNKCRLVRLKDLKAERVILLFALISGISEPILHSGRKVA